MVQHSSSSQGAEPAGSNAVPGGDTSSPQEEVTERSLQVDVASFTAFKNPGVSMLLAFYGVAREL